MIHNVRNGNFLKSAIRTFRCIYVVEIAIADVDLTLTWQN